MELTVNGTCHEGHDWAVYTSECGEWEMDGGSDVVRPDEDREEHPRVTCPLCQADAQFALGIGI